MSDMATQDQTQQTPPAGAPTAPPSERFADSKVLAEAPNVAPPHERFKGFEVYDSEEVYNAHISDAGLDAYNAANDPKATKPEQPEADDYGVMDWIGDVGRSTIIGAAADPLAALVLSKKYDVSYGEAKKAILAQREAKGGESLSATLVGAVLGGGVLAAGMRKGAQWAATKSGLAESAMRWAAKDTRVSRYVAAAGVGAAAGTVEEGIRAGIEEGFDAYGGEGFDGKRVMNSIVMGGLIGTAAGPALQAGMGGGKWVYDFFRRAAGSTDAQAQDAARRLQREFAEDGETMEAAADRFAETVRSFREKKGYMPTAGQIMRPEQVRNSSEIIAMHNGLDIKARRLGEKTVRRSLKQYDKQITGGPDNVIPSREKVESDMELLYEDVMDRKGHLKTKVPDEIMASLQKNRDYIEEIGNDGNAGAAKIGKILRLNDEYDSIQVSRDRAINAKNDADATDGINAYKVELQQFIRKELDDINEAAKKADPENPALVGRKTRLQSTINYLKALQDKTVSARNVELKGEQLRSARATMDAADRAMKDYADNGVELTLSDANDLRKTASMDFNSYRLNGDPQKMRRARFIRDTVAPIGKETDEEFAMLASRFNMEMLRSEAQETGVQAAKGAVDLMDLETRLTQGRLPGNTAKARTDGQQFAIEEGAAEGFRRTLQNETRSLSKKGNVFTSEAVRGATRVASNKGIQKGAIQLLGKGDAKAVKVAAEDVMDTYENMLALAAPRSQSMSKEEMAFAGEVLGGAAFGSLGGAGRAALLNRLLTKLKIPRGTANKMVEMLGDPDQMQAALAYMQRKNIRVGPFAAAISAYLSQPEIE